MNSIATTNIERKKQWTAPKLKRIDIEQITANIFKAYSEGSVPGS